MERTSSEKGQGIHEQYTADFTPHQLADALQKEFPVVSRSGLLRRQHKSGLSLQQKEHASTPDLTQDKASKKSQRRAYWTFLTAVLLGVAGAGALIGLGVFSALPKDKFCIVMDEDFSGGLDLSRWEYQVETGGFGNGEFQWTTTSPNNSYVEDGTLYIVPTLTSDSLGEAAITNGYTLNLTSNGQCTANIKDDMSCAVASNASKGVVLPPVQSARIRSKLAFTYGKVQVDARMPSGDWIWPAIWMMPNNSVYGEWPKSGEIDIVESKGNKATKKSDQLVNSVRSSLHWGASSDTDRWYKTTAIRTLYRNFYDQSFHTFGLTWTPREIFTWEGSPVRRIFSHQFNQDFWRFGQIPSSSWNGTALYDPWSGSSAPDVAPFDQSFYLILNVAVGGTNGYFEDGQDDNKPWSNQAENPRADFWAQKDKWLPSWPTDPKERGMAVKSVKIWERC